MLLRFFKLKHHNYSVVFFLLVFLLSSFAKEEFSREVPPLGEDEVPRSTAGVGGGFFSVIFNNPQQPSTIPSRSPAILRGGKQLPRWGRIFLHIPNNSTSFRERETKFLSSFFSPAILPFYLSGASGVEDVKSLYPDKSGRSTPFDKGRQFFLFFPHVAKSPKLLFSPAVKFVLLL
jgi:hypothetical protein